MPIIQRLYKAALYNEVKGAAFYNKAAESTKNSESRMLFLQLAGMEDNHTHCLIERFKGVSDAQKFDANGYIKELESFIGNVISQEEMKTLENSHINEILEMAINMEKEAGKNYMNLAELLEDEEVKKYCRELAEEEGEHAESLNLHLLSLDMEEEERPAL